MELLREDLQDIDYYCHSLNKKIDGMENTVSEVYLQNINIEDLVKILSSVLNNNRSVISFNVRKTQCRKIHITTFEILSINKNIVKYIIKSK